MAEQSRRAEMSRHEFSVAYDGAETADDQHGIDVQTLSPALLAFGKLVREANAQVNGKRATSKVLVVSDFEHKCFNINFEVLITFYDQVKTLLGSEPAETAKRILEWLGLLGVTGGGSTLAYLQYLKWKNGRKISNVNTTSDVDGSGVVEVTVEGDHNSVQVHNHVYQLSQNPRALRATRDAFLPLGSDGYDMLRVTQGGSVVEEIPASDVESIVASCNVGLEEAKAREQREPDVDVTPAWLSVYSPVFDPSAPNWRFRLGKEVIYADISETNIADDAIARGEVGVDDAYQVSLEITTPYDEKGNKLESSYRVLRVIRFVPAGPPPRQKSLFEDGDK